MADATTILISKEALVDQAKVEVPKDGASKVGQAKVRDPEMKEQKVVKISPPVSTPLPWPEGYGWSDP